MWRRQSLVLLLGLAAAAPAPAQKQADDLADIVVTARPGPPSETPKAPIDFLTHYCAEPMRRDGRFADLAADPDWMPLDAATRARFGVTDKKAAAFGFADTVGGRTLLMKQERLVRATDGMVEQRCTLAIIGGKDEASALYGSIARFIGGPGTQRHVGARDGAPAVANWRQWLWTAYPRRGAKRWELVTGSGSSRAGDTYLVVHDPRRFYAVHDYVFFDLKVRERGAVPLALASFVKVSAPDKPRRR